MIMKHRVGGQKIRTLLHEQLTFREPIFDGNIHSRESRSPYRFEQMKLTTIIHFSPLTTSPSTVVLSTDIERICTKRTRLSFFFNELWQQDSRVNKRGTVPLWEAVSSFFLVFRPRRCRGRVNLGRSLRKRDGTATVRDQW